MASFDGEIRIGQPGEIRSNTTGSQIAVKSPRTFYVIPIKKEDSIDESLFFLLHNWSDLTAYLYQFSQTDYKGGISMIHHRLIYKINFSPSSTKKLQVQGNTIIAK